MAPRWQELLVRHKGLASVHDKGIDNTHWVALANVVVDHLKQKRRLRPIRFSKRPRDNHRVLRPNRNLSHGLSARTVAASLRKPTSLLSDAGQPYCFGRRPLRSTSGLF